MIWQTYIIFLSPLNYFFFKFRMFQDIAKFFEIMPYVAPCGDLNNRTGKIIDFEQVIEGKDSELISILKNNSSHIFRPKLSSNWDSIRQTRDQTHNNFGEELINLCKSSGIRII